MSAKVCNHLTYNSSPAKARPRTPHKTAGGQNSRPSAPHAAPHASRKKDHLRPPTHPLLFVTTCYKWYLHVFLHKALFRSKKCCRTCIKQTARGPKDHPMKTRCEPLKEDAHSRSIPVARPNAPSTSSALTHRDIPNGITTSFIVLGCVLLNECTRGSE